MPQELKLSYVDETSGLTSGQNGHRTTHLLTNTTKAKKLCEIKINWLSDQHIWAYGGSCINTFDC